MNIFPVLYDLFMFPIEVAGLKKLRMKVLKSIDGEKILEIGVGTGLNFKYYPDGKNIIALEPKIAMLESAKRRAKSLNKKVRFINANVENMPFKDETFDLVFATFVFCEVKDIEKGFSEVLRVLKPGGKITLLEHVRPEGKIFGKIFDIVNIFTAKLGENINRKTALSARSAGIKIENISNVFGSAVILLTGRKPTSSNP